MQTLPRSFDDNPAALGAFWPHILHESDNQPTNRPKQPTPDGSGASSASMFPDQRSDQHTKNNPDDEVIQVIHIRSGWLTITS